MTGSYTRNEIPSSQKSIGKIWLTPGGQDLGPHAWFQGMILVMKQALGRGKEYSLWKEELISMHFLQSLSHASIIFFFGVSLRLFEED